MSLPQAVRSVLTQYVGFTGRASRAEFWMWFLAAFLINAAVGAFGALVDSLGGNSSFTGLVSLVLFLPTLAVTIRRLHDSGRTGWWAAFLYGGGIAATTVLVLGFITLLVGALHSQTASGGGGVLGAGVVVIGAAGLLGLAVAVTWLVLMTRPSTPGDNAYGPPNPHGGPSVGPTTTATNYSGYASFGVAATPVKATGGRTTFTGYPPEVYGHGGPEAPKPLYGQGYPQAVPAPVGIPEEELRPQSGRHLGQPMADPTEGLGSYINSPTGYPAAGHGAPGEAASGYPSPYGAGGGEQPGWGRP